MKPVMIILILLGCALQALFIKVEHEERYVLADILKGSASLFFVLLGLLCFKENPSSLSRLLLIGLFFGMIGDILLNLRYVFPKNGQKIFLLGILAFLIGHILYLIALLQKADHTKVWYFVIIGAVLAALLLIYIFKTMEVKTAFKIFGIFYLGAVFIMTAVALGIAVSTPSKGAWIYAIGAVLFTASDVVLIFNTFSGVTKFSLRITNLTLYYIGQLLIALSLLY